MRPIAPEKPPTGSTEPVTFYAWTEGGPKNGNIPSNLTINVSGGQREKDSSGVIRAMPHKAVKFQQGKLTTDDPEVIQTIRKFIKAGDTITEDQELYLKKTMPADRHAERVERQNQHLREENNRLMEELRKRDEKK